jgi:hypothetical protein
MAFRITSEVHSVWKFSNIKNSITLNRSLQKLQICFLALHKVYNAEVVCECL